MTVYFDSKTNGFYSDALRLDYENAGTWPIDLVEISDRWYQHLIDGQTNGKIITANEYGQPVLTDPPPPTRDELITATDAQKQLLMTRATTTIAPLQDAVDLGMATDEETASLQAWKKYRVLLNRVDTSNAPDIEWPSVPVIS